MAIKGFTENSTMTTSPNEDGGTSADRETEVPATAVRLCKNASKVN